MNYESTISGEDVVLANDEEAALKRKRILIIAAVVVLAIAGAAAYYFFTSGAGDGATAEDEAAQAATVTVTIPGTQNVARTITATGTLAARRDIPVWCGWVKVAVFPAYM